MHRLLERIDGAASTLVPLAYLAGMLIGTAAYFSGVVLDAGLAVGLAMAVAVEIHGFLAQRRMRATWGQLARIPTDDPERERLVAQLRANVAVLAALIALSMYNGAAFLAHTWPIVPGFLPAGVQIAIRAVVLPVLFLASGFLTPLHTSAGDVLQSASREMLHRAVRATLLQWRRRIDRAQRSGLDLAPVAVALMIDAGDTDGARRIELIARGLERAERVNDVPSIAAAEMPPPDRFPTGPGTPAHVIRAHAGEAEALPTPATLLRLPRDGTRTQRGTSRRAAKVAAERVRARREQQIADWLAEEPDIATRELVRRLQRAEHTRRISESTVAALRRVVEARLALVSPLADAATQQAER